MKINANFSKRVVVHSSDIDWLESPMKGVHRKPLDRVGVEIARATSIVRYAPSSHFSTHVHTGGEEFLVLDGVFQDEHGDFPAGSYIRNPPQSSHTPGSTLGCVIFVKLWQFAMDDRTHVRLNSNFMKAVNDSDQTGVATIPLYFDEHEQVEIQLWQPKAQITIAADDGLELLVLAGSFEEGEDQLKQGSWLRLPPGSTLNANTGEQGSKVWIKQNHLGAVTTQIERVLAAS